jgi:hypothetical protein
MAWSHYTKSHKHIAPYGKLVVINDIFKVDYIK